MSHALQGLIVWEEKFLRHVCRFSPVLEHNSLVPKNQSCESWSVFSVPSSPVAVSLAPCRHSAAPVPSPYSWKPAGPGALGIKHSPRLPEGPTEPCFLSEWN